MHLPDHYALLGLDRRCTPAQIRAAYRVLARQHHPDLNPGSPAALQRTQELNAAYETLSDPDQRTAYDLELNEPRPNASKASPAPRRETRIQKHLSQDVHLRLTDFLRGTTRAVYVKDPANPDGPETYQLEVPPETAPGTRFRIPREGTFASGFINVRVKALPGHPFKVRGSDVACDLKIKAARAEQGGTEMVRSISGGMLRVNIPRGAGRHEIIRLTGEGLPKPRGGRGDLLVRIVYQVEVHFSRPTR